MIKSTIALSAVLTTGVNAFWRLECPGRVGMARMDPIVNFGETSVHAHTFHGSNGISETSKTDDLLGGDCSSCRVKEDKSAYWIPMLYFQDQDSGKLELVDQVGGILAYYLLYGDNIKAFPRNFQMISGDTKRRSYTVGDAGKPDPDKSMWASLGQESQSDLAQRALGFNCLNYQMPPEGTLYRHQMPDKDYLDAHCTDGLRIELMFPSCWDGKNTDSANHKDHVAFPNLVMTGDCPSDHPVRLPSLMFESIWNTYAFKDRKGRFVWSNGDPTGYGMHGDFVMGWEDDILEKAISTCTNPSGRIEDCPVFNLITQQEASQCKMPDKLSVENLTGPMMSLPGNVKITTTDSGNDDEPAAPQPSLSYKPGEQPTDKAKPLPGQVFKESKSSSPKPSMNVAAAAQKPSSTSQAPPPPPPATTPAPAPESSVSYFSTEWVTRGNTILKILWDEEIVTVTETADAPAATMPATPAAKKVRRGAHLHHRRGHHGF